MDAVEVPNNERGDWGVQVRPEAGEGGKLVVEVHRNVEGGKGPNTHQLDSLRLDFLDSVRQARQSGQDEVPGDLPEGEGCDGVAKSGRQGRHSIVGEDFL